MWNLKGCLWPHRRSFGFRPAASSGPILKAPGSAGGYLRRHQFGNADQVIGDQVEQEVGGDTTYATVFGLAHGAMLLAPSEDALDHRPA